MCDAMPSLTLALWARKFATLMGAGASLVRCLEVLSETDEGMRNACGYLNARLLDGATLSQGMTERPDVFPSIAIAIVRAGEVGGVLDEAMAVWADWLARDLAFRARYEPLVELACAVGLAESEGAVESRLRAKLREFEDRVHEFTCCSMLGLMLTSNVPAPLALDVAADLWPGGSQQAEALLNAANDEPRPLHRLLAPIGFSPVTCGLVEVGEETGQVGEMLLRAADVLQHELEARMMAVIADLAAGKTGSPRGI